ncbi:MAG: hypothetical protein A2017_18530 [Lentisphaerae bacterium GWF2_44_16]|nr:MAG: hypothetical protein A2017_18530 [Lentisphaerae bacterium GWF2_44_16]
MSFSGKKTSVLVGVIAGLIDVIVTVSAMIASNSSVLLADALKTSLEFVAVLVAWYTMRRISKGSGENFQYGIGKLENISSIIIALLMAMCIMLIIVNAVKGMMHPEHIEGIGIWISMISQVVYGVVNGFLWVKNRKLAAATSSPMMASQAKLFLTRMIGNIFIFVSVGLSCLFVAYGWVTYIDPVASMLIAASILFSAMGILSNSLFDLMDRTLEESDQIVILQALAKYFQEYEFMHGVRSRRSGSQVFIDIFLEFQQDKTFREIQTIVDSIRHHIENEIKGSHVTIGLSTRKEC